MKHTSLRPTTVSRLEVVSPLDSKSRFLSYRKWLNAVVGGCPRSLVPKYVERLVGSHRRYLECMSPYESWLIVALHRGGMIAPLLGGTLLFIDHSFPVYVSVVVYLVTVLCIVLLHETAEQGGENGQWYTKREECRDENRSCMHARSPPFTCGI